jgi:hypothetical protein
MTTSSASSKLEKLGFLAIVILAIVVIGVVMRSFVVNPAHAPGSPERGTADLTAAMACTEFNRAIEDHHAGVITANRFTQRMEWVFNAGRLAHTPLAREIVAHFQWAGLHGSRDDYTKAEARMKFLCHTP